MWTLAREMSHTWRRGMFRRSRAAPRVALVTCVRDEARWLPLFLRYHHAVGIERAYLFCDRCNDSSTVIAAQYPWVNVLHVAPDEAEQFPYIADLHRACMDHALGLAREEGIDWLLIIDPDEFACGDNPGDTPLERAQLQPLVARSRPETVQIRLATREIVPQRLPDGEPFWRHRFVQRRGELTWNFRDPVAGDMHAWTGFLGHREGKALVRTTASVQGFDSHRWVPQQGAVWPRRPEFTELPTEHAGYHLHYYLTGHHHWIEKFRKQSHEPDVWICGTDVELPKRMLRRAALSSPAGAAADYFARYVSRPEKELVELARRGIIEENHDVVSLLQTFGAALLGAAFRPLSPQGNGSPTGVRRGWTALDMPVDHRQGFFGLERHSGDYFRWAQPDVAVRLAVPPGDYRLRVDMKSLRRLWRGRLDLWCDDRPIPCRHRSFAGGVVQQELRRGDLSADPFWLRMHFDPIDTSTWPNEVRRLGAPIFSIDLAPLA
jgi:hypothetical protein